MAEVGRLLERVSGLTTRSAEPLGTLAREAYFNWLLLGLTPYDKEESDIAFAAGLVAHDIRARRTHTNRDAGPPHPLHRINALTHQTIIDINGRLLARRALMAITGGPDLYMVVGSELSITTSNEGVQTTTHVLDTVRMRQDADWFVVTESWTGAWQGDMPRLPLCIDHGQAVYS